MAVGACPQNETTTLNMQMRPNLACFLCEQLMIRPTISYSRFGGSNANLSVVNIERTRFSSMLLIQISWLGYIGFLTRGNVKQNITQPEDEILSSNPQQSGAWRRQQLGGRVAPLQNLISPNGSRV